MNAPAPPIETIELPLPRLEARAAEAAALLRGLANEHRLLILCHLAVEGELGAGEIVRRVDLGQSAVSQHLARLREQGLIAYRRESQNLYYRIADPNAARLLELLRDLFCPELKPSGSRS